MNNNENPNNPNIDILHHHLGTNIHIINKALYPIVRAYKDINPCNIDLTIITGDGNCLYRAISHFLFGHQLMFNDIRNEIYNTANSRKNLIPDVIIETSNGNMRMHDYINSIKY